MIDTHVEARCRLLISNRDAIRNAFKWDSSLLHLCTAAMYTMHGITVDPQRLQRCKQLISQSVGVFNNFRSTAQLVMAAMMDLSGEPEVILDRSLVIYDKLKAQFMTSTYLPMSAMVIARHVPVSHYDEVCAATRTIYNRMRKEHPFLTSSEDCAYCTLMAITCMDHDKLLNDMEACYTLLKGSFFSGNALQSLSHALALYPIAPADKVERTLQFYQDLRQRGYRWGTNYELSMLGVVALTSNDRQAVLQQVIETADWLKQQKGFGFWSSISTQQRLMYAGMLVNSILATDSNTNMTSMITNSVISAIIAQQAATSAAIAASTAH